MTGVQTCALPIYKEKKKFKNLNDLLKIAEDLKLFRKDTIQFHQLHAIREFGNYIHHEKEIKEEFKPDIRTAKTCYNVIIGTIEHLQNIGN